ncbi:MAG: hypothetical protein GY810_07310 [Aureispira sp.]|nr:hypothetical protein [Aureispira sp.]
MYKLVTIFVLFMLIGCQAEQPNTPTPQSISVDTAQTDTLTTIEADIIPEPISLSPVPNRDNIRKKLQSKIDTKQPLVVHVFVPLCDNENQGIVPTSRPSLGNGLSLKSNLYWATSTGMKKYFKTDSKWQLLDNFYDVDSNVLERVVFRRNYSNGAIVYLVADAYRGDRMEATVNDYLRALSNSYEEQLEIDSQKIAIHGGADFMVFNGHNGLMDMVEVQGWTNTSDKETDAAIIACISSDYFEEYLIQAKAYPLLRCNHLLHPGAYVLSPVIDGWVNNIEDDVLKVHAGRAYCKRHKCSAKTSRNYFSTGWAAPQEEIVF